MAGIRARVAGSLAVTSTHSETVDSTRSISEETAAVTAIEFAASWDIEPPNAIDSKHD